MEEWKKLNPNSIILKWINGYKLKFEQFPLQSITSNTYNNLLKKDQPFLLENIKDLLKKGVITQCKPVIGQFLSPFFLVDNPNGKKRFILNLKKLNVYIKNDHFKMEDWRTVVKLLQKNWLMSSIDLKEAYFLIPVHVSSRKYLRFSFKNNLFEFKCLPFGLSSAPYVYTKLMKPVISFLHKHSICCTVYLDDYLILAESREQCQKDVDTTINLLQSLGFIINVKKSSLVPQKRCKYLGFIFDFSSMSIELPKTKKIKILNTIHSLQK